MNGKLQSNLMRSVWKVFYVPKETESWAVGSGSLL